MWRHRHLLDGRKLLQPFLGIEFLQVLNIKWHAEHALEANLWLRYFNIGLDSAHENHNRSISEIFDPTKSIDSR